MSNSTGLCVLAGASRFAGWPAVLAHTLFLGSMMLLNAGAAEAPKTNAPVPAVPAPTPATNAAASTISTDKLKEFAAKPTKPFEGEALHPDRCRAVAR